MGVLTVEPGVVKAIYETKKLRSTGSHTQVIDVRADESKAHAFELYCVTHDVTVEHNVRLKAEELSHRSHMWCGSCVVREDGVPVKGVRANAASRKHGTNVVLNAMPDKVVTFPTYAPVDTVGAWKKPAARRTPKA